MKLYKELGVSLNAATTPVRPLDVAQWMASTICDVVAQSLIRGAVGDARYRSAVAAFNDGDPWSATGLNHGTWGESHGAWGRLRWFDFTKEAGKAHTPERPSPEGVGKPLPNLGMQLVAWAMTPGRSVAQLKFDPGGGWHTLVIEKVTKDKLVVWQGYKGHHGLAFSAYGVNPPPIVDKMVCNPDDFKLFLPRGDKHAAKRKAKQMDACSVEHAAQDRFKLAYGLGQIVDKRVLVQDLIPTVDRHENAVLTKEQVERLCGVPAHHPPTEQGMKVTKALFATFDVEDDHDETAALREMQEGPTGLIPFFTKGF